MHKYSITHKLFTASSPNQWASESDEQTN